MGGKFEVYRLDRILDQIDLCLTEKRATRDLPSLCVSYGNNRQRRSQPTTIAFTSAFLLTSAEKMQ